MIGFKAKKISDLDFGLLIVNHVSQKEPLADVMVVSDNIDGQLYFTPVIARNINDRRVYFTAGSDHETKQEMTSFIIDCWNMGLNIAEREANYI